MAAQAETKQKAAEAALQAKIDAEVEKRTKYLAVLVRCYHLHPRLSQKPTPRRLLAPDPDDARGSVASGAPKGAKRLRKHAERAEEVAALADRFTAFEEACV